MSALKEHDREWRLDSYIKNLRTEPYYLSDLANFEKKLVEDMGCSVEALSDSLDKEVVAKASHWSLRLCPGSTQCPSDTSRAPSCVPFFVQICV